MSLYQFTWCDLSTFDLEKACSFYGAVFNWSSHSLDDSLREDDYTLFYSGSDSSAGAYTMPEFFQNIRMPSFWMSYVRVEALDSTVKLAVELGAKCEIEPTAFDAQSRFALVRDPAGAGFTLYEGPELGGLDKQGRPGRMICNELHVPSLALVEEFYRKFFGWSIVPDQTLSGRYFALSPTGESIASILQLDEATKGPKNYWAVVFATDDLPATLETIADQGGRVLMQPITEFRYAMAIDDQGAMFCVSQR